MDTCYVGSLVMPSRYAMMEKEEMSYVEGGELTVLAVCAIVTAACAAGGATYGGGKACGERLYYAGITTSKKWSKYRWAVRGCVLSINPIVGGIFMLGLENKLYSMM